MTEKNDTVTVTLTRAEADEIGAALAESAASWRDYHAGRRAIDGHSPATLAAGRIAESRSAASRRFRGLLA